MPPRSTHPTFAPAASLAAALAVAAVAAVAAPACARGARVPRWSFTLWPISHLPFPHRRARRPAHRRAGSLLAAALLGLLAMLAAADAQSGQTQSGRAPAPQGKAAAAPGGQGQGKLARESVEADVSTRSVAVTSAFRGSEVVVFGTVLNSQQESAESGLYDVVLVVEGSPTQAVVREKSNVGGIWLNTNSLRYDRVPSYFAIVSTRPLDEIADEQVLAENRVGFKHIRLEGAIGATAALSPAEREAFRGAVIRLKQKEGLYFTESYGVAFIGKALFRSTITLPATVKVGPVAVHVLLFRDGELLSRMTSRVVLTRQGIEHYIYATAFTYPLRYGLVAVAIAVAAGLLASLLVRR